MKWMLASLVSFALVATAAQAGRLPRYGGDVRIPLGSVPADLDPVRLAGDDGAYVAECLYEGLTRWQGSDLAPALARSWVRDDEGKRWRFRLRNDVQFHDGTRCDAAVVRQSLERLADPRVSPWAWMLSGLVGWIDFANGKSAQIEGLDVLDAENIELAFEAPVIDLPARLAMPAAAVARRRGEDWLGTGPFQVLGTTNGELRLGAFKDHHDGRPFIDHVLFVARRDAEKMLAEDATEIARVRAQDALPAGMVRWRAPAERLGIALVEPHSATLSSEGLRRRLSETFDRGVFVRAVLGGDGEATEDLAPNGPKRVGNRAGEPPGDLGNRPQQHARIIVTSCEPVLRALGERLQVHLFALGVAADLDVLPAETFAQSLAKHDYDAVVLWLDTTATRYDGRRATDPRPMHGRIAAVTGAR
jgi:peptide/nickel transport system substrate-binding protein